MLRYIGNHDIQAIISSILPAAYINKLRAPHVHWKPLCANGCCSGSVDYITRMDDRFFIECEPCLMGSLTLLLFSLNDTETEAAELVVKERYQKTQYYKPNLNGLMNCLRCTKIIPHFKPNKIKDFDTNPRTLQNLRNSIFWDEVAEKFVGFCMPCVNIILNEVQLHFDEENRPYYIRSDIRYSV